MKDRNRFELILMIVAMVLEIMALVCVIVANVDRLGQCVTTLARKLKGSCPLCKCAAEDDFDDEFEDWDL